MLNKIINNIFNKYKSTNILKKKKLSLSKISVKCVRKFLVG